MEKSRKYYEELIIAKRDYKVLLKAFLSSFFFGGLIGILGQGLLDFYQKVLKFSSQDAPLLMLMTMILLSGILTALGIYDKVGQIAKCGLAIPITGEAHRSVTHFKQIYLYICSSKKWSSKANKNREKNKQNRGKSKIKAMIPYASVR